MVLVVRLVTGSVACYHASVDLKTSHSSHPWISLSQDESVSSSSAEAASILVPYVAVEISPARNVVEALDGRAVAHSRARLASYYCAWAVEAVLQSLPPHMTLVAVHSSPKLQAIVNSRQRQLV